MKATKNALKHLFGSYKEGLEFLKKIAKKKDANVVFAHGEQHKEFSSFIKELFDDHTEVPEEKFESTHEQAEDLLLLQSSERLTNATIKSTIKAQESQKSVFVSSEKRPSSLDHIFDPGIKVLEIKGIDWKAVQEEIEHLKKEVHS